MSENSRSAAIEIQDKETASDVLNDPSALASESKPCIIRINSNSSELF